MRDLDVLLEHLTAELATLGEDDRAGSAALIARLEHQRNDARRRLVEGLSSENHRLLLARLRFPPRLAPGVDTVPLDRIARKEFRRVAKASAKLGRAAERFSSPRAPHRAEAGPLRGRALGAPQQGRPAVHRPCEDTPDAARRASRCPCHRAAPAVDDGDRRGDRGSVRGGQDRRAAGRAEEPPARAAPSGVEAPPASRRATRLGRGPGLRPVGEGSTLARGGGVGCSHAPWATRT